MSKLPEKHRFLDLSDYGRPIARIIASSLKSTSFTPVHVTLMFVISGLIGIACIIEGYYWSAAFFLIFKSILDAADGELARIKETPSYVGRFLDSISDLILNLLILVSIWFITDIKLIYALLAFLGIQLQGTLYNYYYVILRNMHNGDTTSRVFEDTTPVALEGEKQSTVNKFFRLYKICYGSFDNVIYFLDRSAAKATRLPNWLMTAVSTFGLGFQLLIISTMLVLGWKDYIIPFFIYYSIMILVFIGIRKAL